MPAFAADYFGSKNVGPIYGLMLTAWGCASAFGPLLIAHLRQVPVPTPAVSVLLRASCSSRSSDQSLSVHLVQRRSTHPSRRLGKQVQSCINRALRMSLNIIDQGRYEILRGRRP